LKKRVLKVRKAHVQGRRRKGKGGGLMGEESLEYSTRGGGKTQPYKRTGATVRPGGDHKGQKKRLAR